MGMFPVSPEKEEDLVRRMASLGVHEEDLQEQFVRSGGHGGQNVNKVATCVVLLHRPSQMQVKCQTTRRQGMNRYLARLLLLAKLEKQEQDQLQAQRAMQARLRHQKKKRSRAVKEQMLADKRRRSDKKSLRRRVMRED